MNEESAKSLDIAKENTSESVSNQGAEKAPQQHRQPHAQQQLSNDIRQPWSMSENSYLLLMHLSLLSGFVIPLGGLILPLVMWLVNKDEFPAVNQHGKMIANWIISYISYTIVGVILSSVFVGILLLVLINVCAIVFAVIAGVKASRGALWRYPLSVTFIK